MPKKQYGIKNILKDGEALRYLDNAREILRNTPVEGDIYSDKKPVREVFATAYLAVLEAINEILLKKGLTAKQLPKSVDGYRDALMRYLSVNNGKLMKEFNCLYESLHIAGYYRGLLYRVPTVKDELDVTEKFIKKLLM
ncbi:MAG: DUF5618 family protein [Nitrospirae bacterium]|nr:DUF5618 family protein [Nitrospirota bacterium]MBF0590534.1 DUF5618 family protein [Nitrospirota bacterium]